MITLLFVTYASDVNDFLVKCCIALDIVFELTGFLVFLGLAFL